MVVGILMEKPSAAKALAVALGGNTGVFNGEQYVIASARGHLFELDQPQRQISGATVDEQRALESWSLANLPWDLGRFDWGYVPMRGADHLLRDIKTAFSGCDEIVCGTDCDPTGEGGLIFANIAIALGYNRTKKITRMYFTDESPASFQKAFTRRVHIPDLNQFDEYLKASYRSAWDFGSIQWTRCATLVARQQGAQVMLRQGRLKSAMVKLVGDQLKAYEDYVKKPFFQNRFRDENAVMYTNPEEPTFPTSAEVPQQYGPSPVVLDSRTNKRTAPPKLLDLAGLSSMLAAKGIKAKTVLSVYQKMYEAQVVSYPRTEDRTITPEQFKELSPLVDQIAAVVGVDAGLLTVRAPRPTHVKPQGAHGANRPGPKVPSSLVALEATYGVAGRLIYEALAKNYLAMLAEDYLYERQEGHLRLYPDFKGAANVPKSLGWKQVFNADAELDNDPDEDENSVGLGTTADPFVFEGANKRPEHPSMKWLMKQLEKRDVGTGATRTSTYSEVTSEKSSAPLLKETRGKLTLADAGRMSWMLLPGTYIGDLGLTERVYAEMRAVAEGKAASAALLGQIAGWVQADIEQMKRNATSMAAQLGLSGTPAKSKQPRAKHEGVWLAAPGGPRKVQINKDWSGHAFTDEELAALLRGEEIEFSATARSGSVFDVWGKLSDQVYKGKSYVAFEKLGFGKRDANGAVLPPSSWCGHVFTPEETATLIAGEPVAASDFVSTKNKKSGKFSAKVWFKAETPGEAPKIVPEFEPRATTNSSTRRGAGTRASAGSRPRAGSGTRGSRPAPSSRAGAPGRPGAPRSNSAPPKVYCNHTFTDDELASLTAGQTIFVEGMLSGQGNAFDAKLTWREDGERPGKRIVPEFI